MDNDFLNPQTGQVDPKHMFGTSNFDVFCWDGLVNGTMRQALGSFITTIIFPGMLLVCLVKLSIFLFHVILCH